MNNNKISLPYMLYDTDCKEYVYGDGGSHIIYSFHQLFILNLLGNPCYSNYGTTYDKLRDQGSAQTCLW